MLKATRVPFLCPPTSLFSPSIQSSITGYTNAPKHKPVLNYTFIVTNLFTPSRKYLMYVNKLCMAPAEKALPSPERFLSVSFHFLWCHCSQDWYQPLKSICTIEVGKHDKIGLLSAFNTHVHTNLSLLTPSSGFLQHMTQALNIFQVFLFDS